MFIQRIFCRALVVVAVIGVGLYGSQQTANAQLTTGSPYQVSQSGDSLDLIVNTSRVLTFEFDIPKVVVENNSIVRVSAVDRNQILVTGIQQGFCAITCVNDKSETYTINVSVVGDVRRLENTLKQVFPESRIKVTPIADSVILSGSIARADQIESVTRTARKFFPDVENNLNVADPQLVAVEVRVYEISRSRLRELGIDWSVNGTSAGASVRGAQFTSFADNALQLLAPEEATNIAFGLVSNGFGLEIALDALEKKNLAKLLDQPTLISLSGRPAEFLSGGEVPFEVAQGLGTATIEFRPFGTKLDIVPVVLGQGRVRLEVRSEVSEPASDLSNETNVPGFRVRRVNTGVEMTMGHTLILAGDYKEEVEAEIKGIPILKDAPYIGSLFRRVEETTSESELVIMMTPRFVHELDPSQVPARGPGQSTTTPSNGELYHKGFIEVPKCQDDCPTSFTEATGYPLGNSFGYPGNKRQQIQARPASGQPRNYAQPPTGATSQTIGDQSRYQQPPVSRSNQFSYPQR